MLNTELIIANPMSQPIIAMTPGEPAGIGPDIALKISQQNIDAKFIVFADSELLKKRASQLKLNIVVKPINHIDQAEPHQPDQIQVLNIPLNVESQAGILDKKNSAYVLNCLKHSVSLIQDNKVDALVTGPLHKGIINESGLAFTGHTEFLAELTQGTPVMMLAADTLRVALATTHLPLNEVSAAITKESLQQVIEILHYDLKSKFAISNPKILICGLNPHAGEGGHLGLEEIEVIEPVLNTLRKQGMDLSGPLPADTLFTPKYLQQADAVLAMYHDQGLPVLKHVGFGRAINITLGLPIIRTSVDHGTALDLAGTGKVDTGSLQSALSLAIELAKNKSCSSCY
jgi:4-hydroxythreonine-4-phosphate dehydrogenase